MAYPTERAMDSPRVSFQSGMYTQIALYAGGNALSLALAVLLFQLSAVLADFRDPMLYALLCSIALRGPKDWLVQRLDARLDQDRCVAHLRQRTPTGAVLHYLCLRAHPRLRPAAGASCGPFSHSSPCLPLW